MTKPKRNYRQLSAYLFLTGAVLAYKWHRYLRKPAEEPKQAPTPKHPPNPPQIEWISAGSDEEDSPHYLTPMFDVGDTVVTVNPFSYDYAIVDVDGMTPLYYEIRAIALVPSEGTVRYLLEGEDDWFAEDWLDYAPYPEMCAEVTTTEGDVINLTNVNEMFSDENGELKSDTTSRLNDEFAEFERKGNIDRLLDVMNEGTAEEKAEAERALKELISGEESV